MGTPPTTSRTLGAALLCLVALGALGGCGRSTATVATAPTSGMPSASASASAGVSPPPTTTTTAPGPTSAPPTTDAAAKATAAATVAADAKAATATKAAAATAAPVPLVGSASVRVFKNCAELNLVYPHGVGRAGAVDHVSGGGKGVTTFTVDDEVYDANPGRDGDNDGIACEKR